MNIASTSQLKNFGSTSQPAYADGAVSPKVVLNQGTWGDWPAPDIIRVQIFDYSSTVGIFVGDLVVVEFDQATNGASTLSTDMSSTVFVDDVKIGSMFDFPEKLFGVKYTGLWDRVRRSNFLFTCRGHILVLAVWGGGGLVVSPKRCCCGYLILSLGLGNASVTVPSAGEPHRQRCSDAAGPRERACRRLPSDR